MTNLSVRTIAEQTGFSNVKHRPERFKSIVGCSMSAYRGPLTTPLRGGTVFGMIRDERCFGRLEEFTALAAWLARNVREDAF